MASPKKRPPLGALQMSFDGSEAMHARLGKIAGSTPHISHVAIATEARTVLHNAKEKYVPVETEKLRDSGKVVEIDAPPKFLIGMSGKVSAITREVEIHFGGGRVDEYAIPVHEHISDHSPPSWHGKNIKWTKPGTGPKYLEKPLKQAQRGIAGRMALRINNMMNRIPGAFVSGRS